ncbi:uncharacterized protein LOC144151960 [Haemaphysalis longicornis]
MQHGYFVALLTAFVGQALVASAGHNEQSPDVPDSFKIFEKFPHAIAISNSDNDTIFECLTVKRMFFDKKTMTTEYVWLFKGHHGQPKKTVAFYAEEGPTPDKFFFMESSEASPKKEGQFYYTDYKTCAVMYMDYHGGQCILWSEPNKRDSLPQECMDEFAKSCGVGVPTYSKDLCDDDELALY